MFSASIRLNTLCENCQSSNFLEDQSGFYVCEACGMQSQVRCGAEVDIETFGKNAFMHGKSKIFDANNSDNDEDQEVNDSIENFEDFYDSLSETSYYTNKNSKSRSRYGDGSSTFSRRSSRSSIMKNQKKLEEILLDKQKIFENIFLNISQYYFKGKNIQSNSKISENTELLNSNMVKFGESDKKKIKEKTKDLWVEFISKAYTIESKGNTGKRRLNFIVARSRDNTFDDTENIISNISNFNNINVNPQRPVGKRMSINNFHAKEIVKKNKERIDDMIKKRNIKKKNVYDVYNAYNCQGSKNIKITNKQIIKKFAEEYDQVLSFVKTDDVFLEMCSKTNNSDLLDIDFKISYEQLIRICKLLQIDLVNGKNDNSFEELIHKLFVNKSLNYQTTNYNIEIDKSILNGDNFLFILYKVFNSYDFINILNKPLLVNDLIYFHRNFYNLRTLNDEESLKLYKYKNYDNFKQLICAYDKGDINLYKRCEIILKYISKELLNLNDHFYELTLVILSIIFKNNKIINYVGKKILFEEICVVIIIFSLKIIYGLNNLPYLYNIYNLINKDKSLFYSNNKHLSEVINSTFINNINKDLLWEFYKSMPSQFELLNKLICLVDNKLKTHLIYNKNNLKNSYNYKFKKEYTDAYYKCILKNIRNDFSLSNIKELENKFKKSMVNSQLDIQKEKKETKFAKVNVKFSKKFMDKKVKHENYFKNNNKLNGFLEEEIDFHKSLMDTEDDNIEFPFPCDTYIRYKKNAFKFMDIDFQVNEIVFMYYFSLFYNIDFTSMKSILKFVENNIEKWMEQIDD